MRWPLVAILLFALLWVVLYTLRIKQYFIQPDELEYVRQAVAIGHDLHPIFPSNREFTSWSQLQPLLMAPAWTVFGTNTAFTVQHIINALVMVSAGIPAYLLAQRVTGARWAAYVAAAATVTVPWMAMSATMMTEVVAYPAFLWGVLAVQNGVARPSARNDVLALLGIGLALFARPQLLVLAPALVVAAVVQTWRFPVPRPVDEAHGRLRAAVRTHPVLLPIMLVGIVVLLAGGITSRHGVLGTYSDASSGTLFPPGSWAYGREALSYIAIAVGVLPLSLSVAWVLATVARPASAERHAFAVIGTVVGIGLVLVVGSFSQRFTGGVNSRYLFYLAPLLLIGTLALVTERRRLLAALAAGALIGAWLVHTAVLALRGPSLVSPESAFHDVLFGRIAQLEGDLSLRDFPPPRVLAAVSLLVVLGYGVARWKGRATLATGLVLVIIGGWLVAETGYAVKRISDTQKGVSQEFIDGRDWIDKSLPDGARAPMLVSSFGDPPAAIAAWWDAAFWNKKIDQTMQQAGTSNYEQPFPDEFTFDQTGTAIAYADRQNAPFGSGPYLVRASNDRRYGLRGLQVVAERNGVQIATVPRPVRAAWALTGADDTGLIAPGASATLYLYPDSPGTPTHERVTLGFQSTPGTTRAGHLLIRGDGVRAARRAPAGQDNTFSFDVDVPADMFAAVTLTARNGQPGKDGSPPPGVLVDSISTESIP